MPHNLCIVSKKYPDRDSTKVFFELMAKNGTTLKNVSRILQTDFWVMLYNENQEIIAECSVQGIYSNPFTERIRYFCINDVYVKKKYRGNNYSVLLLLNVFCYFRERFPTSNAPFRLFCGIFNSAAYECYKKVFGEPYMVTRKYFLFSIK